MNNFLLAYQFRRKTRTSGETEAFFSKIHQVARRLKAKSADI
jgi:hypothetical protein